MEISQVNINNTPAETRLNLADDVMRLLQVRERNADMSKDWLLFISTSNFKITAGEIYLAFKMALSREILDSNGKEIDLFPELSNNTTGKVISAYLKSKNESLIYQNAKDKLKLLKMPSNEVSEIEKEKIREYFIKSIFDEITSNGFSADAHHLFFDLENSGKLKISVEEKKKLYDEQLKIYVPAQREDIKLRGSFSAKHLLKDFDKRLNSGKPLIYVVNKCRSIAVSNYLKNHLEDFEVFKKALE
ncbi:hypothetical protein [Flavobacterium sp. GT3P67]|uniref:hypothetical protein n=1 Tax=Flavobacterium sp. GT3P67 TaxID=2541722 RepID=UPI0010F2FC82|nr:hypothetical protein [Flavobacterium sp. GT3P67]TDE53780.1 hypothetical protein E0H99_07120 [Flavobacterium sp. GT3P67]